ncbi:DUF4974 domain-containing protein [Aurantibacter crassamenti]|uniref:FecR family protein n=1 Tax=Aurantibacter crassamenti TaxID=1837375 RepID=UPI00193927E3|nr:FecR family protein [Aurantibacter crassamenti]MBM1106546.1 DUF4974 domain-containing protein [Aurantibacter crassamenti]
MSQPEIDTIIVKFLNREADIHELESLDSTLKNKRNIQVFQNLVKTYYITERCMHNYDVDKAKKLIKNRLKVSKRQKRLNAIKKISIAASVLILLGTSFFVIWNQSELTIETTEKVTEHQLKSGANKAVLTLEDGNQIALEKGKDFTTNKIQSNGEEIVYKTEDKDESLVKETLYNYLTIPRGGQFFVQLSDGSKVWLNSDTKLKYPVKFQVGQTREVELVYGEAYFEVSPHSEHQGAKFLVLSKSQKIEVLGTKFNLKAYDGENSISTTLVEGKVNVSAGNSSKILIPNQQSRFSLNTDSIQVVDVDVSEEISWIDGIFTFNEMPLDEMMRVLSRWYDAEVFFKTMEHKSFVFTGKLERTKSVREILELIEATSEGQISFEVKNKTIIIE